MIFGLVTLFAALAPLASANVCTVPFGGPGVDDSVALNQTIANCTTDSTIVFTANTTYNISTPVNFGTLKNVDIQILGNLDLPQSIPYVQSIVNASGGRLYWFTLKGDNVTISGNADDPKGGIINAYGQPWWDAAPNTQPLGGLANRPHGWSINANNTVLRWLKIEKPIAWGISLSGDNNHVYEMHIDASYDLDNPSAFPFNTDGFDVHGDNVLIENSWVSNGDDCVAVNQGNNITVRNMVCIGGHGASLSAADDVNNVLFDNITSWNSLYATRFKSSLNAVGNISNVTWSNIYVLNATFPVFATGLYFDQNTNRGKTPTAPPANSTATHISNFSWINVTGTISDIYTGDGSCTTDPCWYSVPNITNTAAVTLQLLNGTATNIHLENINLVPIDGKGTPNVLCDPRSFTDGTDNLGFQCANGPYVPSSS